MDYRKEMLRTMNHDGNFDQESFIINATLGLTGEAGEVSDHVKKWLFQGHELDTKKLINELGDIRYYLELACYALGVTMEQVEQANSEKLRKRYPNGFSPEASLARVDTLD